MFTIGAFARLTRVSVRMLRHYDELGLLRPRYTDSNTGFRYYGVEQLTRLNRLIAFKDLGFSLEQIALLLDANLSGQQLKAMFEQKKKEVAQQMTDLQQRLSGLDWRAAHLEKAGELPDAELVVRRVEPQLVAAIRLSESETQADSDRVVSGAFDRLERFAARHRIRQEAPPLTLYNWEDEGLEPAGFELAVPITRERPADAPIRIYELPGFEAIACLIHTGTYRTLSSTLDLLLRRVEANRLRVAGPLREVYLRFGADQTGYKLPAAFLAEQESDFLTELQLPVNKILAK